jgi:dihydrofolate synthase/folylpolyglutamate synthase
MPPSAAPPRYEDVLAFLDGFTNYERVSDFTAGPETLCLDRMRHLLDQLGRPQDACPALHIAGTKGKGSTATMAAALLQAAGRRVGLFTSPHLVSVRERIVIDGTPVSRERFCAAFAAVRPALEATAARREWSPPTYFETLTAMAFVAFAAAEVDLAVLEVGLGGRFDSTNVVRPVATAITPVSLDHTRQLGDTLGAIAAEKAGILKPSVPLVLAPQPPEAEAVIRGRAAELDAPVLAFGEDRLQVRTIHPPGPDTPQVLTLTAGRAALAGVPLPLLGRHQSVNAAVAAALVDAFLAAREEPPLTDAVARRAWRPLRLPARLEITGRRPWVLVDGAHNPASAWALAETLQDRFAGARLTLIFGAAQDKDIPGMLRVLAPLADRLVLTESGNPRGLPAANAVAHVPEGLDLSLEVEPDPREALTRAVARAGAEDVVCVAGSLYLAGRVRRLQSPPLED